MVRDACLHAPAGARLTRLTIVVGEASGHDPHHIQEHFTEASRGTPAEGATLDFVHERLTARCANCGSAFSTADLALCCNHCGSAELIITGGNDVRLSAVECDN